MKDKPLVPPRRTLLKAAVACAGVAVAPPVARQKPGLRIRRREEVANRDEPYLGRTCSKFVLYQGDGKCVILSELVNPNRWCTQWVPATMG
jgi:hypothetical protein